MIDFYTRTAIRLKKYQALFIAIWGLGIIGGAMTMSSDARFGQALFGFVFAPMFCFGWSLFLTCLWFHPAARAPGRESAGPSSKQLSRMAAIITLLIICGAVLGPAALLYSR